MNNPSAIDLNLTSFKSLVYFEWDKPQLLMSKWVS